MAGNWYTIQSVCYECGPHGEDTFKIYDHIRDMDTNGSWTIQKDENGLNYENWFSLTDNLSGFDTHDAFENLYEDNGHGISLEDGTTIVFPYDFKEEDVYKVLHWLKQNGWEFGYSEQDLKSVLYDLDKKWNKGKRRIFFMLRKNDKPWKQEKIEKMVYWAPVGKLESAPATFTNVIKAEDFLSSIDTDFFITESTDDFSWVEDFSKYIKVGQRFTFRSRLSEYSKEVITGQIIEVNPKYIRIVPVNKATNKINPFTKGTKFTPKRLMELLTSGDWTPVKS